MDKIVFSPEELMKEIRKSKKKRFITLIESEDDVERKRKEFHEYLSREQILFKIMMDKMIKQRENIIFSTIAPARMGMSFIGMNIGKKFGMDFMLDYYKMKEKYLKKMKGKLIFDDEQLPRKSRRYHGTI